MRIYVPTESRATMLAFREGCTLDQFLDGIWYRREKENPRAAKSTGKWPYVRLEDQNNVMPMKKRGKL